MARVWSDHSSPATAHADNPRDYTTHNTDCLYYNWNHLRGADSGASKSGWQWVGGDMGFTCGFASEAAMEATLTGHTVAIRVSVSLLPP